MNWRQAGLFAVTSLVTVAALAVDGDAETTLHFRSHYLDRDKSVPADNFAWAAGGWFGYRTGWWNDAWRLGLTAYTSQKVMGPPDQDGAALLLAGQRSYTVLGESFASLRMGGQTLTAGRFLVNRHEVNPQDTRMTPRTFQGVALEGEIAGAEYFLGRFDRMKHRHWDHFERVATVAGAAESSAPLWLLSVRGAPRDDLSLGFATYHVRDLLVSTYADAAWLLPLGQDVRLRLGGQVMRQGSTGKNLLTGAAFDTWSVGIKADLIHGPLTLSGIAMRTGDGAAYRMPFGSWAGYTSRIINNFNRAGEAVRAGDALVDFAPLGIPGLSLAASATVGKHAINAATGAALSENTEYDITGDYRFSADTWPHWARPIRLRARWGRFEQRLGDIRDVTTEYHLILNYTVIFK